MRYHPAILKIMLFLVAGLVGGCYESIQGLPADNSGIEPPGGRDRATTISVVDRAYAEFSAQDYPLFGIEFSISWTQTQIDEFGAADEGAEWAFTEADLAINAFYEYDLQGFPSECLSEFRCGQFRSVKSANLTLGKTADSINFVAYPILSFEGCADDDTACFEVWAKESTAYYAHWQYGILPPIYPPPMLAYRQAAIAYTSDYDISIVPIPVAAW